MAANRSWLLCGDELQPQLSYNKDAIVVLIRWSHTVYWCTRLMQKLCWRQAVQVHSAIYCTLSSGARSSCLSRTDISDKQHEMEQLCALCCWALRALMCVVAQLFCQNSCARWAHGGLFSVALANHVGVASLVLVVVMMLARSRCSLTPTQAPNTPAGELLGAGAALPPAAAAAPAARQWWHGGQGWGGGQGLWQQGPLALTAAVMAVLYDMV